MGEMMETNPSGAKVAGTRTFYQVLALRRVLVRKAFGRMPNRSLKAWLKWLRL